MSLEHNFTFIYKDDYGNRRIFYPKTLASQVTIVTGETLLDHIHSDKHLMVDAEVQAFRNTDKANGLATLDSNGYIRLSELDGSLISIRTEFKTIDDMLEHGDTVVKGALVMVLDATGDARIKSGWSIYRRVSTSEEFWDLQKGWICLMDAQSIDIPVTWDTITEMPISTPEDIDKMVLDNHQHDNFINLEKLSLTEDGHLAYDGKAIAYKHEVPVFIEDIYVEDEDMRFGDFWLKPDYSQQWWYSPAYINAGSSCYMRFANQDTLKVAPKLITADTINMNRMFIGCYELEQTQQYQVDNVIDMSFMYKDCISLKTVPIMDTRSCEKFTQMFGGCSSLKESPEMNFSNAKVLSGLFSECTNLKRVLPFRSTSKAYDMQKMFYKCTSLNRIYDEIDFSSITEDSAVENMFFDCIDLEELHFVDGTLKCSLSLEGTNLSKESLLGILDGLANVTNKETSPTLNLGLVPSVNEIPESVYEDARAKGWTILF